MNAGALRVNVSTERAVFSCRRIVDAYARCVPVPTACRWRRTGPLVALLAGALAGVVSCGDDSSGASGGASARGEERYEESCAACHGADLRGTGRGPAHLSVVYEPDLHSDDAFRSAVRSGARAHHWDFGDMPPVPGLDDDEIDAIIAYVREVQ